MDEAAPFVSAERNAVRRRTVVVDRGQHTTFLVDGNDAIEEFVVFKLSRRLENSMLQKFAPRLMLRARRQLGPLHAAQPVATRPGVPLGLPHPIAHRGLGQIKVAGDLPNRLSMMDILSGPKPLILDVRQSGSVSAGSVPPTAPSREHQQERA